MPRWPPNCSGTAAVPSPSRSSGSSDGAGGVLSPTFPGSAGQLATYFHCFVEPADFERVGDELRSQPGVLAAYLKPGDALP